MSDPVNTPPQRSRWPLILGGLLGGFLLVGAGLGLGWYLFYRPIVNVAVQTEQRVVFDEGVTHCGTADGHHLYAGRTHDHPHFLVVFGCGVQSCAVRRYVETEDRSRRIADF